MFVLKKIFQLREKVSSDHEKPFLEHLEDLRICVTRIVVTLLIAFIACFAFHEYLFKVMQRPIDRVWENQVELTLPTKPKEAPIPLDAETWEQAKKIERTANALPEPQRESFYNALEDPQMRFHTTMVALVRAVGEIPENNRDTFIASLQLEEQAAKQLAGLLEKSPNPNIDSRGNLRTMSALKPTETFMLSVKLSFFAAIVISFPLLLMFILQFVLPGLHENERRVLWPSLTIGFGLFLTGVLFAYLIVLPLALDFFQGWGENMGVANDWRIGEYITFATQFTLLFGLSFELPVVVMALVKIGLLSYTTMSNTRSYAILAIFVAAAVITPTPDALTLSLMAGPMILLYEICIWLAWFDERKQKHREKAETNEHAERRTNYITAKSKSPDLDEKNNPHDPDSGGNHAAPAKSDLETIYESSDDGWDESTPIDPHDAKHQNVEAQGDEIETPDNHEDPYWYHNSDDYHRENPSPHARTDKPKDSID